MRRRNFIAAGTGAWAIAELSGLAKAFGKNSLPTGKRPNLLFVFSDQQSWDMMGCYGNTQIHTPGLDRFAEGAIRFNQCISTCPVCSPMRGTLLTGQYPLKHAVVRNDHHLLCTPGESFGGILKDNGYRMGYVGKWHLLGGDRNRPVPRGDRFGFEDYFYSDNCHVDFRPGKSFYYDSATGKKTIFKEWEQVGQTQQALHFLDECDPEDPFALFVSWHPPHNHAGLNYFAPPELEALYPKDQIQLRPDAVEQDSDRLREEYCGYMALISSVDDCFDQLMLKLEERGLADNTIVVFTADHGDMMRYKPGTPIKEHGNPRYRMFKSDPRPTASHVPLLIRWPGQLRPRTSELLFGSMDFMPTLLGMMGLSAPEGVDGRNLSHPIWQEDDRAVDSIPMAIFTGRGWRGIYTQDHIYAFDLRALGKDEIPRYQILINHREDPYALDNHYGDPAYANLQKELHARTLAWMEEVGDEGWSYDQICDATLVDPAERKRAYAKGHEMKNKGRPLDLLRAAGIKGRFSE